MLSIEKDSGCSYGVVACVCVIMLIAVMGLLVLLLMFYINEYGHPVVFFEQGPPRRESAASDLFFREIRVMVPGPCRIWVKMPGRRYVLYDSPPFRCVGLQRHWPFTKEYWDREITELHL